MTLYAAHGNAQTFDYTAGDIAYIPTGWGESHSRIRSDNDVMGIVLALEGHYIENTGNTTLKYLEIWNSSMWICNTVV